MTPPESAVVVCIPEAEPLVDRWRQRYDASAAKGVPAHITLLYPFVPPDDLSASVEADLELLFATVAPFDVIFRRTNRFDDAVLFLDPDPDRPFLDIIRALSERFRLEPYGGTIPLEQLKPHVTVVDGHPPALDEVETELRRGLPIASRVSEAWLLIADDAGRWTKVRPLSFGAR